MNVRTSGSAAFSVVGAPSSVGSHNAGQELAPQAWRRAGLLDALRRGGLVVSDRGDLATRKHWGQPRVGGVRAAQDVQAVAAEVSDSVAEIASQGEIPVVLGGDCTVTLGVVAGLRRTGPAGLLYFDGDVDLNTPELSGSGVLDTMGVTHLLGGGVEVLANLGGLRPLLAPQHISLFGFDPAELDEQQWSTLVSRRLEATPAPAVRADPPGSAALAWDRLSGRVDRIVLHFDVDVLNTGAFPIANYPHFNGLSLSEARLCLAQWVTRPELAALVITEVNPTHDPDNTLVPQLVEALSASLSGAP